MCVRVYSCVCSSWCSAPPTPYPLPQHASLPSSKLHSPLIRDGCKCCLKWLMDGSSATKPPFSPHGWHTEHLFRSQALQSITTRALVNACWPQQTTDPPTLIYRASPSMLCLCMITLCVLQTRAPNPNCTQLTLLVDMPWGGFASIQNNRICISCGCVWRAIPVGCFIYNYNRKTAEFSEHVH